MSEAKGGQEKEYEQQVKIEIVEVKQGLNGNQNNQKEAEEGSKKEHEERPQQVVTQLKQTQPQSNQKQEQKLLSNSNNQLFAQQKLILKTQLESMQFQPYLIEQAILTTSTLDQAIEFIINRMQLAQNQESGISKQVKLFFIVRMDLKMGTGKIAAQVGHASLRAFQNMRYSSSNNDNSANLLIEWMENGQKNQILQAQTENDLQYYLNLAGNKFINNCYIRDAGRTQIAAGSMTVAAIGPVRQSDAQFLKKLKEL